MFEGQPKGLFALALANTGERFGYYTMLAVFALFLRANYGLSPALAAGLEFSNRHVGHFILEGRYYYGLGNIYGNTKRDYFGRSNYGAIIAKLTYLFDIIRTKNSKIK